MWRKLNSFKSISWNPVFFCLVKKGFNRCSSNINSFMAKSIFTAFFRRWKMKEFDNYVSDKQWKKWRFKSNLPWKLACKYYEFLGFFWTNNKICNSLCWISYLLFLNVKGMSLFLTRYLHLCWLFKRLFVYVSNKQMCFIWKAFDNFTKKYPTF